MGKNNTLNGTCLAKLMVVLITLCVSGVALLMCGLFIGLPGFWSINFKETTCQVIGYKNLGSFSCKCKTGDDDADCTAAKPCVQVTVSYNLPTESGFKPVTSMIYNEESDRFTQCSRNICYPESEINLYDIFYDFLPKYGKRGTSYKCYYDPNNPEIVLRTKEFSPAVVIVSVAVPGIFLLISVVALIYICCTSFKSAANTNKPDSDKRDKKNSSA